MRNDHWIKAFDKSGDSVKEISLSFISLIDELEDEEVRSFVIIIINIIVVAVMSISLFFSKNILRGKG